MAGQEAVARAFVPSLDAFNVIDAVAHGNGISLGYVVSMKLVFVGMAGALLAAGVLAFGRRDL
jgi:hypothetical protein